MRKTLIALLLCAAAVFSACGSDRQDTDSNKTTADSAAVSATTDSVNVMKTLSGSAYLSDFEIIAQLPELPCGCEVTSLAMALEHAGYEVDKCDLADNYLKKGAEGVTDYREAFIGDPRDEEAFGCYAPVLIDCADSYLSNVGSKQRAVDLTGSTLEELLSYLDNGIPVVTWCTFECQDPTVFVSWEINGETLDWIWPEHCVVLIGYDEDSVWVADPYYDQVISYGRWIFNEAFTALSNQAIIIR